MCFVAMVGEGLLVVGLVAVVVLIPIVAFICALVALAGAAERRRQCTRLEIQLSRCFDRIRALEGRSTPIRSTGEQPVENRVPTWARPPYARKPAPPEPAPEPAPTPAQDVWVEEEPEPEPACPEPVEGVAPEPPPQIPPRAVEPVQADAAAAVRSAEKPPAPHDDAEGWEDIEGRLGRQWLTWGGAVVLMLSAGFLVKYAFDHNWLSPGLRVLSGVLIGLATGAAGERFLRRDMRALGQGLIGLGIAIAMIALYAGYEPYDVLTRGVTFPLMLLVVVAGMTLAIRHDSLAIAVLAMLGGLIIPFMLRTGLDSRDALFAYLLLLDAGVLAVAYFKRWRALDVLAFAGTWIYFTGWYFKFGIHYDATTVWPPSLWLGAFFIVFMALPFIYCLRKREAITGDRFAMTILNVMLAFGWAYTILHGDHQHMLGLATSAMAALFLALGVLTRKRTPSSEHAVFSFIAIAIALFTIAIPIHYSFHVVTIAWAIEAPLLLYLAYRYDYLPVRTGSIALLLLAVGRLFTIEEWPMHTAGFRLILNADFLSAIFVALAGAAFSQIHHKYRALSSDVDSEAKVIVGIGAGLLALLLVNTEFWQWLQFSGQVQSTRRMAMLLCGIGAIAFLACGWRLRSVYARVTGFFPMAAVLFFAVWEYGTGAEAGMLVFCNTRFLAALFGTGVVFMYAWAYLRTDSPCTELERDVAAGILACAITLLTVLVGVELWQGLVLGGHVYAARCLSPLVALSGAVACMACGVRMRSALLRDIGLTILPISALLTAWPFTLEMDARYILFVNGRFLSALAAVVVTFGFARALWSGGDDRGRSVARTVCGAGIVALFVLLSVETYLYFQIAVSNASHAAWAAQMSLTILWGLFATGLLLIGFSRNIRTMRLSALGLFAATSVKLVLVDMVSIKDLYRVLAFMVLGSLMIGASYVYHRVEKRLLAEFSDEEGEGASIQK